MPRIPEFIESLEKLKKLHESKNEDYASKDNPFMNFELATAILTYFYSDADKAFVWPIANKLGRLGNLLSKKSSPNHESVLDSLDDIACYALLWKAYIMRRGKLTEAEREVRDDMVSAFEFEVQTGEYTKRIYKPGDLVDPRDKNVLKRLHNKTAYDEMTNNYPATKKIIESI